MNTPKPPRITTRRTDVPAREWFGGVELGGAIELNVQEADSAAPYSMYFGTRESPQLFVVQHITVPSFALSMQARGAVSCARDVVVVRLLPARSGESARRLLDEVKMRGSVVLEPHWFDWSAAARSDGCPLSTLEKTCRDYGVTLRLSPNELARLPALPGFPVLTDGLHAGIVRVQVRSPIRLDRHARSVLNSDPPEPMLYAAGCTRTHTVEQGVLVPVPNELDMLDKMAALTERCERAEAAADALRATLNEMREMWSNAPLLPS
jgi:hypothetical protein